MLLVDAVYLIINPEILAEFESDYRGLVKHCINLED